MGTSSGRDKNRPVSKSRFILPHKQWTVCGKKVRNLDQWKRSAKHPFSHLHPFSDISKSPDCQREEPKVPWSLTVVLVWAVSLSYQQESFSLGYVNDLWLLGPLEYWKRRRVKYGWWVHLNQITTTSKASSKSVPRPHQRAAVSSIIHLLPLLCFFKEMYCWIYCFNLGCYRLWFPLPHGRGRKAGHKMITQIPMCTSSAAEDLSVVGSLISIALMPFASSSPRYSRLSSGDLIISFAILLIAGSFILLCVCCWSLEEEKIEIKANTTQIIYDRNQEH